MAFQGRLTFYPMRRPENLLPQHDRFRFATPRLFFVSVAKQTLNSSGFEPTVTREEIFSPPDWIKQLSGIEEQRTSFLECGTAPNAIAGATEGVAGHRRAKKTVGDLFPNERVRRPPTYRRKQKSQESFDSKSILPLSSSQEKAADGPLPTTRPRPCL